MSKGMKPHGGNQPPITVRNPKKVEGGGGGGVEPAPAEVYSWRFCLVDQSPVATLQSLGASVEISIRQSRVFVLARGGGKLGEAPPDIALSIIETTRNLKGRFHGVVVDIAKGDALIIDLTFRVTK